MTEGVFTTIKVKDGLPLFLEKHLTRLRSHAKALSIKTSVSIEKKISNFLEKNNLTDCALRVVITNKGEVVFENRPLPFSFSSVSAISLSDKRDKNKIYKTTNRKINMQVKNIAEKNGADDALFVLNGKIIESTIANVFSLHEKGQLITPSLDSKGLKGISRQVIMENAKVIEQDIPEDTKGPLVLVNSLRIQKVNYLNGKKLASPEKLFKKIKKIIEKAEKEYDEKSYKIFYKKLSNWTNSEDIFVKLFSKSQNAFWIDSSLTNKTSRFSYMGIPTKTYSYSFKKSKIDVFSFLDNELSKKIIKSKLPFSFSGGYVGYFGYELKNLIGAKTKYKSSHPDSLWYLVEQFIAFDHKEKKVYLVCLTKDKKEADEWISKTRKQINTNSSKYIQQTEYDNTDIIFKLDRDKEQYLKDINKCKEYLLNGESYQICLTNKLMAKTNIDSLSLYLNLRKTNPAPYSVYLKYNDLSILCSSPEQFLKIDKDRVVETKPIKGTIKRGATIKEDKELYKMLSESKKDWSENAMIVDLLRNDLGRVCEFGSVKVEKLMEVESYKTVHQLVSTIKGRLRKDATIIDCIKSCFPGGSMTGAPKIRTMEINESLEKKSRGIYSGSIGFLSFNQTALLNIVIRTIIMQKNKIEIGAGGAILIDSDPEKEYDEMLLKTQALMNAILKTKKEHTVFLALGSNVGNKKHHILDAVEHLRQNIENIKVAKLYETKPMYFEKQNNFINTVLKGQTNLSPDDLLKFVKQTEKKIGRKKTFKNGPREIDIDILFYDDLVLKNKDVQIPHPLIQERDFVLKPFMDLDPKFTHPTLKKNIKELFTKNSYAS